MDPFSNPGIISTTDYRNLLNTAQNDLSEFQNDPYQRLFNALRGRNKQAEETARLNAEAEANRQKVQQEQKFRGQEARTESSNIAGGLSRYAPELASSQMGQVQTANLARVEEIQGEEDLAIARAKEARAANDLDVLQEQIGYIQQLRKAKADALAEANRMAFDREKFEEDKRQFNVTNARLSGGGSGGSNEPLSLLDIGRIYDQYGIELPFGTTEAEAIALLNQEDEAIDGAGEDIVSSFLTGYSKGKLFNLAQNIGVVRKRSGSRKPEIEELKLRLPQIIAAFRAENYTDEEIREILESKM